MQPQLTHALIPGLPVQPCRGDALLHFETHPSNSAKAMHVGEPVGPASALGSEPKALKPNLQT